MSAPVFDFTQRYGRKLRPEETCAYGVRERSTGRRFRVGKLTDGRWVARFDKYAVTRSCPTRAAACLAMSAMLDQENAR